MNLPIPLLLCASALLSACDPITLGLMTAGGGAAVNHQMSATATRTFSQGAEPVHMALLAALDHMSIQVTHSERRGEAEHIDAKAGKRTVSLQIEPVTRTSTQLEVAVHQDLFTLDGATGREIVAQTEVALNQMAGGADSARLATAPNGARTDSSTGSALPGRTTYFGYDKTADADRATAKATKVAKARPRPSAGATPAALPAAGSALTPGSLVPSAPVSQLATAAAP